MTARHKFSWAEFKRLKAVLILTEARALNNLLSYYTGNDAATKVRGRR